MVLRDGKQHAHWTMNNIERCGYKKFKLSDRNLAQTFRILWIEHNAHATQNSKLNHMKQPNDEVQHKLPPSAATPNP